MKISPELISEEMRAKGFDENTEFASREDMVNKLGEEAVVAIETGATAHVANVENMVGQNTTAPAVEKEVPTAPVVDDSNASLNPQTEGVLPGGEETVA